MKKDLPIMMDIDLPEMVPGMAEVDFYRVVEQALVERAEIAQIEQVVIYMELS